jgi:DNA-binding CsgD family transcriptional regulator
LEIPRLERQVLELLIAGKTRNTIAQILGISESYTYTITTRLKCRCNTRTLNGLVVFALTNNLITNNAAAK